MSKASLGEATKLVECAYEALNQTKTYQADIDYAKRVLADAISHLTTRCSRPRKAAAAELES